MRIIIAIGVAILLVIIIVPTRTCAAEVGKCTGTTALRKLLRRVHLVRVLHLGLAEDDVGVAVLRLVHIGSGHDKEELHL